MAKAKAERDRAKTPMSTIVGWLTEHDLAQYVSIFAHNVIDIDVLFDLTETDLEKPGNPAWRPQADA